MEHEWKCTYVYVPHIHLILPYEKSSFIIRFNYVTKCTILIHVKVSYEDLVELVGKERKFDLLVVGLQEAPKANVDQLLQTASSPTHE